MLVRIAFLLTLATSAAAGAAECQSSTCDAAAMLQGQLKVDAKLDDPSLADQIHTAVQAAQAAAENDPHKMSIQINVGSVHPAPQVDWKAAAAEYIAMTLFVIIGCGSAMSVCKEAGWVLQVALTFGLAITALAYTVGHWSGAQINCAVTLGLVIKGQVTVEQGFANFLMQMLGSITGALILTVMIPEDSDKTGGLATNAVGGNLTKMNAFVGEFLMTFLLMFVVLETAVNPDTKANREMAAVAIGFAVFLAHSVLINIDGCSINPTRTFGPAVVRQLVYKNRSQEEANTEAKPKRKNKAEDELNAVIKPKAEEEEASASASASAAAAAPKTNPHAMCLEEQLVFWTGPLLGAAAAVGVSNLMR